MNFPRTPEGATRLGARVLAILDDLYAVNENVFHANGVLMRLVERRVIGDRRLIEHDHVREHSLFKKTAMIEAEIGGGQPAQSANRFLKRNYFFVAHVLAEEPRKISVRARVRVRFKENAFWRLRRFIGTKRDPRFGDFFANVVL